MQSMMGNAINRQQHGFALGESPGQGAQTSIGLESVWTFDDFTIRDWKGPNDLVISGGTYAYNPGKISAAFSFWAGLARSLRRVATGSTLQPNCPNTHAFWFKHRENVVDQVCLLSNSQEVRVVLNTAPDFGANAFSIQAIVSLTAYDSIGGFLTSGVNFINGVTSGDITIYTTGNYIFVGVSIDPVTARAILCVNNTFNYIDLSVFPIVTGSDFCIGADEAIARPCLADIDEVAFWRRALTVSDFLFLYNNGLGRRYPWDSGRILVPQGQSSWFYTPEDKYLTIP
jgi:hypothetical protein